MDVLGTDRAVAPVLRWSAPGRLADLILPRRCLGCATAGSGLCAACARARPGVRELAGVGTVHFAVGYAGPVGTAVVHFKDRARRDLLGPLAALLALAVRQAQADGIRGGDRWPVLVPVPSSARAARARDGDHMRRLARRVARCLGLRWYPLLYVARPVRDSAELGARDRAANLRGAFAVRPGAPGRSRPGPGRPVLLVDDIVTSGSSLTEAARALRDRGYPVRTAAVIAATGQHRRR